MSNPFQSTLRTAYRGLPGTARRRLEPQPAGTGSAAMIGGTVRRPLNEEEMAFAANLGIEAETTVFLFPTATLGGMVPKNGDFVTDADGTAWTVRRVGVELEGSMYRCVANKQV